MKKKLLLGLMAACVIGGATTAIALTVNGDNTSHNPSLDDAIYLKWGVEQSTTVDGVTDLSSVAQLRQVVVGKPTTNITTGYSKVNFALSPDANKSLLGLKVEISIDEAFAEGVTADYTFTGSDTSASYVDYIAVSKETETTYYLRFTYDESLNTENLEVAGTLRVSLSYSETNA